MKIGFVGFTENGLALGRNLYGKLEREGHSCFFGKLKKGEETLSQWTEKGFLSYDLLVFVGACGIAVRSIAPFIVSKDRDPGVISIDDSGRFIIPLLGGHIGGANEMARNIAKIIGGTAVITTATDINKKFAVDLWAVKNQMTVYNIENIKYISMAILENSSVGMDSDYEVRGTPPEGVIPIGDLTFENLKVRSGFCISLYKNKKPFQNTLNLIPKILTLGIGCRKGVGAEVIEEAVLRLLSQRELPIEAVRKIASIDLKAEEQGLVDFSNKYKIPFETYSVKRLRETEGEFTASDFVFSIVGVDNVCERGAVTDGGKLIQGKTVYKSVTIAIAAAEFFIKF